MAIVNIITANCENNQLSQQQISRQWDNLGTMVQFAGYPQPEDDEELIFKLKVWMKESEEAEPRELAPILLDGDQWLVSNFYTQLAQTIKFQLWISNESETFVKHSPIFAGHIGRSLSNNGEEGDIDVIPLFDPYMEYVNEKVNELIVAAGDVQIDASLRTSGAAADAKATGDAIAGVNGRLDELDNAALVDGEPEDGQILRYDNALLRWVPVDGGAGGVTDDVKAALLNCFRHVAWADNKGATYYGALKTALDSASSDTLLSISAAYTGGNVQVGTSVSSLPVTVTATYSSGVTKTIRNYTFSADTISEGTNVITVTYLDKTATFTVVGVVPVATLVSLSATYTGGDVPIGTATEDLTGLTVIGHYSDSSSLAVTGYTLSPSAISAGANTITVSLDGATTTFSVTGVNALVSIDAECATSYATIGTAASDLNITVTGTYSDGTTAVLTGWTITGTVASGMNTFTVNYGSLSDIVTVRGISGFTILEYIESTALTNMVQLDVKPTPNYAFEYAFMLNTDTQGTIIAGVQNYILPNYRAGNLLQGDRNGTKLSQSTQYLMGHKYTMRCFMNGSNDVEVDGTVAATLIAGSGAVSNNLSMFAYNGTINGVNGIKGRIYYMKIYSGTELIRDLVAAKDASDNLGYFDTVNGVFYPFSQDSTNMVAGPEV